MHPLDKPFPYLANYKLVAPPMSPLPDMHLNFLADCFCPLSLPPWRIFRYTCNDQLYNECKHAKRGTPLSRLQLRPRVCQPW